MTTPAIEAISLCRDFRAPGPNPFRRGAAVRALRDVTFSICEGETVAIVGRNGAGKSTLLRALVGLVLPTSGTVRVCGADAAAQPIEARRNVGFASGDERGFYWRLTGRQNLSLFGVMQDMSGAELPKRCGEALDLVGIGDAADRPVGGYSSGMRQRLALARALLHRPRVLLLDEPGRSLDPDAAEKLFEFLLSTAKSGGRTVVFATHKMNEAAAASRVLALRQGTLAHDGAFGSAETIRTLFGDGGEQL